MSSPAREARLIAESNGFTVVDGRGPNWIKMKNPVTKKISLDVGTDEGWHFNNNTQESDSAWVVDTGAWQYKIETLNGFKINARNILNAGNVIQWTDIASAQYVTLQPLALNWVDNSNDSRQQIAQPQAITAQVSDNVLYFPNGYGTGKHFKYIADLNRLNKIFIIDSLSNLPTPTVSNAYLEIEFILTPSSGVNLVVDGNVWDKKTKINTSNSIAFRLSNGTDVWFFDAPYAYDSAGNRVSGILQLRKQGANFYCTVRFPKTWIDSAVFPIMLDPTLDYQNITSANDGFWTSSTFDNTSNYIAYGKYITVRMNAFCRWASVTIPDGATIDVAYASVFYYSNTGTAVQCTIYFNDEENPSAISGYSDGDARTKTTNNVAITGPSSGTWFNTDSLVTIIDELMDSYSYAGGAAMQMIIWGANADMSDHRTNVYSSNFATSPRGPKLHIEYTSIGSLIAFPRKRRFNGLIVR